MFEKLKQLFSRKSVTETTQPLPVETVADVAIKNVIETTTEVVPEKVKAAPTTKRETPKEWPNKEGTNLSNTVTKTPAKKKAPAVKAAPAPAKKAPVIRKVSK
jgi:hypothetical protein